MTREEMLNRTKEIVMGPREEEYGSPKDNFTAVADFWSTYIGVKITPVDVAMMMGLFKIARIKTGTATEDCFVDLAGYAACGVEIQTNSKEKVCMTYLQKEVLNDEK